MEKTLCELREKYGRVFTTSIDDDTVISWKPLSVEEFIKYDFDYKRGTVPNVVLENEIFRKCVIDETYLRQMPYLKAGIISTVVRNIWTFSGPQKLEELEEDLNFSRQLILNPATKILYDFVRLITVAFPYKPDELLAMSYENLMKLVVLAESKLLENGYLKEPLAIQVEGQVEEKVPEKKRKISDEVMNEIIQNNRKNKNLIGESAKDLFDKQNINSSVPKEKKTPPSQSKTRQSPILEYGNKHGINFKEEKTKIELTDTGALTGHDKLDLPIIRDKLIKDAQVIYKDVLDALEEKRKNQLKNK